MCEERKKRKRMTDEKEAEQKGVKDEVEAC